MTLDKFRTTTVATAAFSLAAGACLAAGLGGWLIALRVDASNAHVHGSLHLQNALSNALRGTNELILTSGAKSSGEGFTLAITSAQQRVAESEFPDLSQAVSALLSSAQAIANIKKLSPDNDEAMIAFGKLEASASEVLKRLEAQQAELETEGAKQVGRLLVVALISSVLLAAGIGGVAVLVLRRLRVQVGGALEDAQIIMAQVAQGDFTPTTLQAPTGSMIGSLGKMLQQLSHSLKQVHTTALTIQMASSEVASGSQSLSHRTEQQAIALQQTAATMEELGTTVRQNADNAKQANELAQGASTVAIKGGEVVSQVVETMKGISDSSRRISDIIGTIDGIAFQTNILALNAAVEAARAGEQGRGFAVVASEVRSLAQRSADAAKEIKTLISASVERVEEGAALVDQAGQTMGEVVMSIRRVTDIMGEISAASTRQSSGVAQVAQAVSKMDQATQENTALVEESAAAADSLKNQVGTLVQVVSLFKLAHSASAAPSTPSY